MADTHRQTPLSGYTRLDAGAMAARAARFADEMERRRSIRDFAPDPIPDGVLADCLRAANSAPSGANLRPWHFAVVQDPAVKTRIRQAAEAEERSFYAERAPQAWLDALAPIGTDADKPFLEIAPVLIAMFYQPYQYGPGGEKGKTYYARESAGIAAGILLTALHRVGLGTLTHTPAPMNFLGEILGRPDNERPYLLIVTGYPAPDARVPDIMRPPLDARMSRV